jgi:DNA replication licensing factor MCM4
MQEDPASVPEGETPRSLLMYSFDTNVDAAKPGDKVTITGVCHAFGGG